MGVSGSTVWKQLRGELSTAVDRDFERAVLPLLRLFWPQMTQPRGLGAYDNVGADLIALSDDGIECVVQCKGFFKVEGLTDDQLAPIEKSIAKFKRSGLKTRTYVLLHNQDGRNANVAAKIDTALADLVVAGVAEEAIQWDRHLFLEAVAVELAKMVEVRVAEQSALLLRQMDAQFRYGRTYIADVPVSHDLLSLERGSAPAIRKVRTRHRINRVADALASTEGRWTMLLGLYGSGKTTAALHSARSSPRKILYIHAASLRDGFFHGTNSIMARILDAIALFGEFSADERGQFGRLAAPILRQLLTQMDSDAVLIVDALDENHFLGSPTAITQFASALTELTCSVVLTTRLEHFRATFGNFDHLFDELSNKGGNLSQIALLTLDPWDERQVSGLVSASASEDPDNAHLRAFAAHVAAGDETGWPATLMSHPLFLRMIIDLAAEGADPLRNRAQLIGDWTWRKLTRDVKSDRLLPIAVTDRNYFLERMEAAMERAAAAMTIDETAGVELAEALPSHEVIAIVEQTLDVSGLDLGRAISVSLFVPADVRFRGSVPIRFSHRAFQEYFLARHVVRSGLDPARYPAAVRSLVEDIANAA